MIRTDHQALLGLHKKAKELCGKQARWWAYLSNFDFRLIYRRGTAHGNADGLSRQPQFEEDEADGTPVVSSILAIPEDPVDIVTLQREDPVISFIRCVVSRQIPDSALREMTPVSDDYLKHFRRHQTRYTIKNDILYMDKLAVMPRTGLPSLLFVLHDSPLSGHLGRNRTLNSVKNRFWWPGVCTDVMDYVRSCPRCQARKGNANKTWAPLRPSQPMDYPWQRIALDIAQLPSCHGYEFVLVVVDYFSKWVEAFPLRNKSASTIAKVLLENVIFRFGTPEYLHSDNGKEFVAEIVHDLSKTASIYQTHTPSYAPRGDGQVERQIRTLKDMLSSYYRDHGQWYPYLHACLCALRSTTHETTGFSPYEILFGRKPRLMVDLDFGLPPRESQKHPNSHQELQSRLRDIHKTVKLRQTAVAERMKQTYDTKRKVGVGIFSPGQWVWVRVPPGPRPKLLPKWDGSFLVHRVNDVGSVYVRRNQQLVKTAQDRCKLFTDRPSHLQSLRYKRQFANARTDFSQCPPRLLLQDLDPLERPSCSRIPIPDSGRAGYFQVAKIPILPLSSIPPMRPAMANVPPADPVIAQQPVSGSPIVASPPSSPPAQGGLHTPEPRSPSRQSGEIAISHSVADEHPPSPLMNVPSPPVANPPMIPPTVPSPPRVLGPLSPPKMMADRVQPHSVDMPLLQNPVDVPPPASFPERRRSNRRRAPPARLEYDSDFNQVSAARGRQSTYWLPPLCTPSDLGISLEDSPAGLRVSAIQPGSVADMMGCCLVSDLLTHVNGLPVTSIYEYGGAALFHKSGNQRVTLRHVT